MQIKVNPLTLPLPSYQSLISGPNSFRPPWLISYVRRSYFYPSLEQQEIGTQIQIWLDIAAVNWQKQGNVSTAVVWKQQQPLLRHVCMCVRGREYIKSMGGKCFTNESHPLPSFLSPDVNFSNPHISPHWECLSVCPSTHCPSIHWLIHWTIILPLNHLSTYSFIHLHTHSPWIYMYLESTCLCPFIHLLIHLPFHSPST